MNKIKTDVVIIGGGCAGLMAGAAAGEAGLKAVVLEKKHKPGRKLLMCGNSRCNLTSNYSADGMLKRFGDPMTSFLKEAFTAFTPSDLQRWFNNYKLKTVVRTMNRVYPETERATDVLNLFIDLLRRFNVTLSVSSPVESIRKVQGGFCVETTNYSIMAKNVVVSTGGVSYPKSGSTGDGQDMARGFGHSVQPYQSGLVGYNVPESFLQGRIGEVYDDVLCRLFSKGKELTSYRGAYKIEKWGIGGIAVNNTSRFIARNKVKDYTLRIEHHNGKLIDEVTPLSVRPLDEAMVTVGGVTLKEINPRNMMSKKIPGIYFAGEVMDVDGPTGGFNLHASFACARLAISDIASKVGKTVPKPPEKKKKNIPPHVLRNRKKQQFRGKKH